MKDTKTYQGIITDALPSCQFKVKENETGTERRVYISGRMRINRIICIIGDRVEFTLSLDKTNGRIIKRL